MINFHKFTEILENAAAEVDHETKYGFIEAVGQARQKLADAHRVIQRNQEPQKHDALLKYMDGLCSSLSHLLGPFERKPVLGNGVEFRSVNIGLGSLMSPDGRTPNWIVEALKGGNAAEVLQVIQRAEKTLTKFHKAAGVGGMGGMHEPMIQGAP